jgi:hypothetical protein
MNNGTATCSMICKLRHGLILELGLEFQNGTVIKGERYRAYKLTGSATATAAKIQTLGPHPYDAPAAITEGIPLDFAQEWLRQHSDLIYVKSGMVAICEKPGDAKDMCKDLEKARTGIEPMQPNDDGRAEKDVRSKIKPYATA